MAGFMVCEKFLNSTIKIFAYKKRRRQTCFVITILFSGDCSDCVICFLALKLLIIAVLHENKQNVILPCTKTISLAYSLCSNS